jgi:hypothetical protein
VPRAPNVGRPCGGRIHHGVICADRKQHGCVGNSVKTHEEPGEARLISDGSFGHEVPPVAISI